MSRSPEQVLVVEGSAPTEAAAVMRELAAAATGWVNLSPADLEPAPPTSIWGRINGRGPDVPRITWTAPHPGRGGTEPAQLGIEHPAGGKAVHALTEAGHPVPPGWTRLQDHAMRGLVLVPDPGTDAEAVLRWAFGAVEVLAGFAADGRWQVHVFRGG